jgi:hypothetical protein
MPLNVFGYSLGTLPAWVPPWAVPVGLIHIVMFAVLLIPAWVALARARAFGPLAIFLAVPVLGLWILFLRLLNRVLPYAGWWRIWAILALIPGVNIFFVWVLAFAPWRRRYIPPPEDEDEPAEEAENRDETPSARVGTRRNTVSPEMPADRAAPKFGARTQQAAARRTQEMEAPASATMLAGGAARAANAPPDEEPERIASLTIMAGVPGAPARSAGIAAPTMLAGAPVEPEAEPDAGSPHTMMAGAPRAAAPPPAVDGGTIIAGLPGRSTPPPAAPDPGGHTIYPGSPARPQFGRSPPAPAAERAPPPPPEQEPEPETVRTPMVSAVGGRSWRISGANEAAADLDFALQEATLREAENGILVGRSNRASVTIQHQSISRNHARFVLADNELCVEDLESMNGTWVNGVKLEPNQPVILKPDALIEFGKVMVRVGAG